MGLLDSFQEFLCSDIAIYSLATVTSDWGTTEKEYPSTPTKYITGYIQPRSGSDVFQNQKDEIVSTHVLYNYTTTELNKKDRVVQNGITYEITFDPPKGISGISDHREIGLKQIG